MNGWVLYCWQTPCSRRVFLLRVLRYLWLFLLYIYFMYFDYIHVYEGIHVICQWMGTALVVMKVHIYEYLYCHCLTASKPPVHGEFSVTCHDMYGYFYYM